MPLPLSLLAKVRLWLRIWRWFLIVRRNIHRRPLPVFVTELGTAAAKAGQTVLPPRWLGRAVDRSLGIVGQEPTCLVKSLVLYGLLREQGEPAELVIGLPPGAKDQSAHAWVELRGADIGPAPGRGQHEPIARFG